MIERVNDKIKLTSLAKSLGLSSNKMRFHLINGSGLGDGAEKIGFNEFGDWTLEKKSVLNYLQWLKSKNKKIKLSIIEKVEEECRRKV